MSGDAVIPGTVYPFRLSQARLSPSHTPDCTYFSLGDSAVTNSLQTDSADKDKIEDSEVLSVDNFYLANTNYPCDDMTEVAYLEAPFERHVNCDKEIPHDKRSVPFQAQNKDNGDVIDIGHEITDPQYFHIEANNYHFQREQAYRREFS